MAAQLIQVLLIVFAPLLFLRLHQRSFFPKWLSPVVLSYALGILLANLKWIPIDESISHTFTEACVALAIPLLLFSTNLSAWFKQARQVILAFVLCVLSGIMISILASFCFHDLVEESWLISGMLVGVYTGGTPNMNAIGMALGAPDQVFVLMNAADIFCGGIYLILLTSVVHPVLGTFLPDYEKRGEEALFLEETQAGIVWSELFKGLALAIGILGLSAGLLYLVFGDLKRVSLLLLCLTTLSILASLNKRVRRWRGTYEAGEYLLLLFCVAVGMLSDFSNLWGEGGMVILYTGIVLSGTILLHLLFCRLFKIDRDTAMITSTAALYGPVFIGQIASAIGNRSLVFPGMVSGLAGYAIGNYLGIGIGELLRAFS